MGVEAETERMLRELELFPSGAKVSLSYKLTREETDLGGRAAPHDSGS